MSVVPMIARIKRKKSMFLCMITIIIGGVVLVVVRKCFPNFEGQLILETCIVAFVIKGA